MYKHRHLADNSVDGLNERFRDIEEQANKLDYIQFKIHYNAPDKPRTGQLYYADGTQWNPGSGEGLYIYTSGSTWSKL